MIYTVIDVETTGVGNKITEIAIFRYEDDVLTDTFTSLVNPECLIPDYITALTGIDGAMVAKAPVFSEIAERVLAITKDAIFVAHSVNFDYNMIRNEFKALNINFIRKKLCTVRLSRKLIPGHTSYSLGKICNALDIPLVDRHRAGGDAEATVLLFQLLLSKPDSEAVIASFLHKNSKEGTLPEHLPLDTFNNLPNATGVYYFKDKKDKIIYIGKAKNIQKRVLSHFYSKTEKELNLCRATADIDFELSGSETIALLMEDAAIKHYFPEFNQAAKRPPKSYAIFSYQDRDGIMHLAYNTLNATPNPIQIAYSIQECRQLLENLCKLFNLCPKYCHLQEGVPQCSHYALQTCKGVCKASESVALYNIRVKQGINHLKNSTKDLILKQPGRYEHEEGFILIENSTYRGYGFVDKSEQITNSTDLEPFLIPQKDNVDVQKILKSILF